LSNLEIKFDKFYEIFIILMCLEDGILTLSIPKAEETKPKAIKVKAKEKK